MGSAAGSFYCPFSGGEDTYIENGTSDCLVFMGDAEDTTDAEGSNDAHEVTKVSPTKPGTQKLSSFSVEAKRDCVDLEKLKYINCLPTCLWSVSKTLLIAVFNRSTLKRASSYLLHMAHYFVEMEAWLATSWKYNLVKTAVFCQG